MKKAAKKMRGEMKVWNSHIYENFEFSYPSKEAFEDAIAGLNKQEMNEFLFEVIYNDFLIEMKKH
jgi:hypothetical protein